MNEKTTKEKIMEKLGMIIGFTVLLYILSARNGHAYAKNIVILNIVVTFIIIVLPNRILSGKINFFSKNIDNKEEKGS